MTLRIQLLSLLAPAFLATPHVASAPTGPGPVTVVATDYHLALPASLPAGPTTFRLVNHGKAPHHLDLVRLDQGHTIPDLVKALEAGGPLPGWAVELGGPNAVGPGATAALTTVDLTAGRYAALCMVPVPGGVPHIMKGMISPLEVTRTAANAAGAGRADDTITLVEYGFELAAPLTPGPHTIRVRNGGHQPHELELVRLAPGKSVKDVETWMEAPSGPPPGEMLGGVSPLSPGRQDLLRVALEAGRYALICFLPDERDGKPHFVHGMAREIEVR